MASVSASSRAVTVGDRGEPPGALPEGTRLCHLQRAMAIGLEAPELVGREEELRRIEAFLDRATAGSAALLLEGDAGIGKTTLWRSGVELAREHEFLVLQARPAEAERELSFAALSDCLAPVIEELGRLPEAQRHVLRVALVVEEAVGRPPAGFAVAASVL